MSTATRLQPVTSAATPVHETLARARDQIFARQAPEGYWWYTLEANEAITAEFTFLMHFLEAVDPELQRGLIRRMLSRQRPDGSWGLYHEAPGELSTTVECYFALRLAGHEPDEEPLARARRFILAQGGLTRVRAFTKIHLALFGLLPWSASPAMPVWFMLLPPRLGVSIYEFCSWGRASIVPLLIIYAMKPIRPVAFTLDELYVEPAGQRRHRFPQPNPIFSFANFFIQFDKLLKAAERLPWHPGRQRALAAAERWVREHLARTEDIYPAMAYAAIGLKALGYPLSDPTIQKAFNGLKRFQQKDRDTIHQQCCISPLWDTPWVGCALLAAGTPADDPALLRAGRYLITKQITAFVGDWGIKNPGVPPGGWAFEFQNDYFPDVDDTIQILHFLRQIALPEAEKNPAIRRGLHWLLAMQSRNGGWAAFDKDNVSQWVNKIPFSDHGACLDPPTADITGRMLELLAGFHYHKNHPVVQRALKFIRNDQGANGAWYGRWGVNYLYGTWCVLQGLAALGEDLRQPQVRRAAAFLKETQRDDGGWGESCAGYLTGRYEPLPRSVPSQTAWAVMGLLAVCGPDDPAVRRGIDWLVAVQRPDGTWEEKDFTGTGFPGHFYIRYHGYRHYFPLLALGKFRQAAE